MRWNPEVAAGNPAHVTIVYHDEAPDRSELERRLAEVCRTQPAFDLSVGRARPFPSPVRGAFFDVVDAGGRVHAIRRSVLQPPFQARPRFGLHVTLLHPDQGERLEAAWPALSELGAPGTFTVRSIEIVSGSGVGTRTLATFVLCG